MSRPIPAVAWRLLPSFRTDMVKLVGANDYLGRVFYRTSAGKEVEACDLFDSEREAIEAGFAALKKQADSIAKMQDRVAKRYAALSRCSASLAEPQP